jgi:hypothetical protein
LSRLEKIFPSEGIIEDGNRKFDLEKRHDEGGHQHHG